MEVAVNVIAYLSGVATGLVIFLAVAVVVAFKLPKNDNPFSNFKHN